MHVKYIANFPKISFGLPYYEGALFLGAQYNNTPRLYCSAMPVTENIAMVGGREFFGLSKKIARIKLNKEGSTTKGWIERYDTRFFELEADLSGVFIYKTWQ
ncbi:MAG: acetoacetate decarboxylase family protein [Candidatus Hodarchaeales archaeon]